MTGRFRTGAGALLALTLALGGTGRASAAPLAFAVTEPDRTGPANATYTFAGTVTNETGSALNASDLFFNFGGFDPVVASLSQLLGSPDFAIPDGTTTSITDLFDFTVGPTAASGVKYVADAFLEDAGGDLSDSVTVSVTVDEPAAGATWLLVAGLATFVAVRVRRGALPR